MGVEVEGGLGVVVEVEVHLIAHLAVEGEVDVFVKVKSEHLAVALRECGVVHKFQVAADFQFRASLGFYTHASGSEDLLCRTEVEVHVGEVELFLAGIGGFFRVLLLEILLHRLLHGP